MHHATSVSHATPVFIVGTMSSSQVYWSNVYFQATTYVLLGKRTSLWNIAILIGKSSKSEGHFPWLCLFPRGYILVGGLEHFWFFHSVGNVIIPTDELIFFRGVGQPPTRYPMNIFIFYPQKYNGWLNFTVFWGLILHFQTASEILVWTLGFFDIPTRPTPGKFPEFSSMFSQRDVNLHLWQGMSHVFSVSHIFRWFSHDFPIFLWLSMNLSIFPWFSLRSMIFFFRNGADNPAFWDRRKITMSLSGKPSMDHGFHISILNILK